MQTLRDKTEISAEPQKCRQCRHCEAVCPSETFRWEDDQIVVVHPGRCIRCGHCVAACPNGALSHSALPKEKFSPIGDVSPVDPQTLRSFLAGRRSCRRFADEPLSKEEIAAVIDCTRYAPTPTNAQNVRFLVLSDRRSIAELVRMTSRYYLRLKRQLSNPLVRLFLSASVGSRFVNAYRFHFPSIEELFQKTLAGQDRLFYGAPCVIVIYASGISHVAAASCNLTAMQLVLAAQAMNLGTCISGYTLTALVRDAKMRSTLGIAKGYTPGAVVALGRPAGEFHLIPPRNGRRIMWTDL